MEKKLELCLQACKLECVRLKNIDECLECSIDVDEDGSFIIYSNCYESFLCWETFTKLVEGFRVRAFFGLVHADSETPQVGLFIF